VVPPIPESNKPMGFVFFISRTKIKKSVVITDFFIEI